MKCGKKIHAGRLAVFGLGVSLLGAQPPQEPKFRISTKLVEVTVTVLDKKGKAVTDLQPADFTLLDEGKPRPLAVFRFDGREPEPSAGPTAAPVAQGTFTNAVASRSEAPLNITALVLDIINTPPQQNSVARAQMMRYLSSIAPRMVVGVFVMAQQLHILHDFTDDAASLRARIAKAALGMPAAMARDNTESILEAQMFVDIFRGDMAEETWSNIMQYQLEVEGMANALVRRDRMRRSLAQMETLGAHLAGIPGRKNLVWVGGGFTMASVTGNMGMGLNGSVERYDEQVQQVSRRLAQQGVVLYIVNSGGIENRQDRKAESARELPVKGRGRFEAQMDTEAISSDTYPAMDMMASITGGRYLFNTNDLSLGFKRLAADLQGSYTLGFYIAEEPDSRWHKLEVQVKRPGLDVRHREGYQMDSQSAPARWTEEMWRTAFSNPIASSAIPLTLMCQWTSAGEVAVTVSADTGSLRFLPEGETLKAILLIQIGDRTSDGLGRANRSTATRVVPAAQWESARHGQTRYDAKWKPAANATALRVIIYDVNSGKHGSLDVPLSKVPKSSRQ